MAELTSPPTAARPPISFGAWLGVVLLFLFFGIFVFVLVAATPHGNNYEQKRAEAREKKLNDARSAAARELNSYAWVDKGKGVARIPIDRAMQLTLRDLASKKPEPANPIAAPAETAAPAASPPPPAVSPAATASPTPKPKSVEGPDSENRSQPAAAGNPPGAIPGTQPGPGMTPAVSASPSSRQPPVSPSPMPEQNPPGTPAPAPGKSPP
ncbi:MAG: hypothetical protein DME32_15690 [Verrucomicrobia bacterium]|nr:MAG: hypothetical protein DME32_15690 [Verrucomicrobiota bacterium]